PNAMTLLEHLAELRRRLIVSVVAVVLAAVAGYVLFPQIIHFLLKPYCHILPKGSSCQLRVLSPIDELSIRLQVAGFAGLFLASPVVLWEIWRFVTPGLKAQEKRYAIPFIFATIALFGFGAYVALLTFPHALGFFQSVGTSYLAPNYTADNYLKLILLLMIAFGVTFEFPVVLVSLELARVVKPAQLSKWRRAAIIIISLFTAIVTPSSDPFSFLAMAAPMLVFYEASILIGKALKR
ncbi:MAG TPA: twin-arginine translocase subunit TatC, partial [Acidimicrobiales bacterium]|nr:twin-arginine translocase subunit TatC [Acidimicrobiales bacterium]